MPFKTARYRSISCGDEPSLCAEWVQEVAFRPAVSGRHFGVLFLAEVFISAKDLLFEATAEPKGRCELAHIAAAICVVHAVRGK
jgi:hypothetical protein